MSQLGLDVLARFAGRQLYRIDRWHMVRDLFHARRHRPTSASQGWLADALLQHVPEGGYPPVASGWLDVETVWTHLFTTVSWASRWPAGCHRADDMEPVDRESAPL